MIKIEKAEKFWYVTGKNVTLRQYKTKRECEIFVDGLNETLHASPTESIYKQLATGTMWDLNNPDPDKIFMQDIVTSLSRINRFTGHIIQPFSVLKHSNLVCHIAADFAKPWALVHDVHETFLGDIISPVKILFGAEYINFHAHKHDIAIWKAFGLDFPSDEIQKEVARADLIALSTEAEYNLSKPEFSWTDGLPEAIDYEEFTDFMDYFTEHDVLFFMDYVKQYCPKIPPHAPR